MTASTNTQAVPSVLSALSTPEAVQRRARRHTAANATGVEDCRVLLAMLGLDFSAEERAAVSPQSPTDTSTCHEETRTP